MSKEAHPDIRRTLLFLRRGDQILLAMKKRGFGVGRWNGVGGKLEPGETIEQALVREAEEEIGATPTSYWRVAELDFAQDAETDDPWHMYVYAYLCDEWAGEPVESDEMAPQWYALDAIPYATMWQDDEHWLPLVLAGRAVIGRTGRPRSRSAVRRGSRRAPGRAGAACPGSRSPAGRRRGPVWHRTASGCTGGRGSGTGRRWDRSPRSARRT